MEDPLDFIEFADIIQHGDPRKWKFKGPKPEVRLRLRRQSLRRER